MNTDTIIVSIIVPVYNIEIPYLKECIESLQKQSLREIQIILVDDGSVNGSGEVCDDYAGTDVRIQVIHQENQGVSVARNQGLEHATGEFILFVDADDFIDATLCERISSKMIRDHLDILHYGHICVRGDERVPHLLGSDREFDQTDIRRLMETILCPNGEFLTIAPSGIWGKMFRRSLIEAHQIRFVPGVKRMQDNIFALDAYHYAQTAAYVDFPGYFYRIIPDSVCNKFNPKIIETMERVLQEFSSFIEKKEPTLQPLYHCIVATVLECDYFRLYFKHPQNPASRHGRKKELKALLKRSPYREAVKKASIARLSPRLKVMTFCFRYHLTDLLWLLMDMEDLKNRLLKKQRPI